MAPGLRKDVPEAQSAARSPARPVLATGPTAFCPYAKAFGTLHLCPKAFVFHCHMRLYLDPPPEVVVRIPFFPEYFE